MATAELRAEALLTVREERYLQIVWRRFRRHRVALAGAAVLLFFIFIAIAAPWIAPYDPYVQNLERKNAAPSPAHWLGTDELGRDVLSRLMHAARISLTVAFVVVLISQTAGALIGAISGYFGGWVDNLIQRVVDFMLTLPLLPLLLTISALLSDVTIPGLSREWSSVVLIIFVLSAFGWMGTARLVRGVVLSLREQAFTEAARALGMSDLQIVVRHMIPNAMAPIIVSATLALGTVIILEAALSFLGFGVQPPVPTWGNMLNNAQADMWTQPFKAIVPGFCIFLTSLSFNFVGDGLRDALDPRLKR
ncbi:MAG: peptide ABC transporter permease [Thermoflexus sp.]|uniref:oligopeptide ABC transporter permease n=1 Tax=Thermoflexus sp. TaxID=1969742 RepID=UPI003329B7AA